MYTDDYYKLAGTVLIPQEKREQFNRNVFKILDAFGIRQTEKSSVGGRKITLLEKPAANDEGIVNFNYSLFEKKVRNGDSYHTGTCQLTSPDRGYSEFGLAMNCILALQEAYSETPCFLMSKDQLCPVGYYAILLKNIIGETLTFPHRKRKLDVLAFLKQTDGFKDVNDNKFLRQLWHDTLPFSMRDILELVYVDSKSDHETQEKIFCGEKSAIKNATLVSLFDYLIQEIDRYVETGTTEELYAFYKELLNSELPKRQKLAQKDDVFGNIAEVSLLVPSTYLVSACAEALHVPYWELWFQFETKGYLTWDGMKQDNLNQDKVLPENVSLYLMFQRDNEDEFLEFGGEKLSDELTAQIAAWKKEAPKICVPAGFDTEKLTEQLLWDMEHLWQCRYTSKEAVAVIREYAADVHCQQALLVFQKYMNAYQEYFPEMTPEQATKWLILRGRDRYCRIIMSAFWSLLTNEQLRQDTFGF